MDKESLSHTRANCKYHIVFTPKYRRQVIYGQLRKDIGEILRTLCERKGVTIIEAAACKDHIHMYVEIRCLPVLILLGSRGLPSRLPRRKRPRRRNSSVLR